MEGDNLFQGFAQRAIRFEAEGSFEFEYHDYVDWSSIAERRSQTAVMSSGFY